MSLASWLRSVIAESLSEGRAGGDLQFVKSDADHGSPVRKAREKARGNLPCPACGNAGEPGLRKPRPYSPESERDPGTYFGCLACGEVLALLSGPATHRPSDVPSDRLPDPAGMIRSAFLPEFQRVLARWVAREGDRGDLVRELTGAARGVADRLGISVIQGLRLPGGEKIVPSLVLAGLGNPWLVAFCELPGSAPAAAESISEVLRHPTVEVAVRLTVVESRETIRLSLRLVYPEGEDPVPVEGIPLPVRRRRRGEHRADAARHSDRQD